MPKKKHDTMVHFGASLQVNKSKYLWWITLTKWYGITKELTVVLLKTLIIKLTKIPKDLKVYHGITINSNYSDKVITYVHDLYQSISMH